MIIAQLKKLIKNGESEKVEFKATTGTLTTGMQTVCAFLNSEKGGTVLFGITDKGQITGQQVTDKTRKDIAVEFNRIDPFPKIKTDYIEVEDGKFVIVMDIEPGDKAPYTYDGRAYMRNQTTTSRMSSDELTYLHNLHNPTTWESSTNNDYTLKDLDHERIKAIMKMAVYHKRMPTSALDATIPDILRKLKLVVGKSNKVTNAAMILFGKKEEKQFIQSTLKIGRFRGIDKTSFVDIKSYNANAFDLYDKAIDFLDSVIPVAAWIEPGNPTRVEQPAIPYDVTREALANALVHRDYTNPGGSIALAVYDDRVEITNPGNLPKGVKLKDLTKNHESVLRNPLIAHVFYLCGKIEQWGRGTLDMIKACKAVGNPLPIYEESSGGFSVTLPFKEPIRTVIMVEAPSKTAKKVASSAHKTAIKKASTRSRSTRSRIK